MIKLTKTTSIFFVGIFFLLGFSAHAAFDFPLNSQSGKCEKSVTINLSCQNSSSNIFVREWQAAGVLVEEKVGVPPNDLNKVRVRKCVYSFEKINAKVQAEGRVENVNSVEQMRALISKSQALSQSEKDFVLGRLASSRLRLVSESEMSRWGRVNGTRHMMDTGLGEVFQNSQGHVLALKVGSVSYDESFLIVGESCRLKRMK